MNTHNEKRPGRGRLGLAGMASVAYLLAPQTAIAQNEDIHGAVNGRGGFVGEYLAATTPRLILDFRPERFERKGDRVNLGSDFENSAGEFVGRGILERGLRMRVPDTVSFRLADDRLSGDGIWDTGAQFQVRVTLNPVRPEERR
jgi:hypothetical protein